MRLSTGRRRTAAALAPLQRNWTIEHISLKRLGGDAEVGRGVFCHKERAASRTLNGFSINVDEVFMQASC